MPDLAKMQEFAETTSNPAPWWVTTFCLFVFFAFIYQLILSPFGGVTGIYRALKEVREHEKTLKKEKQ